MGKSEVPETESLKPYTRVSLRIAQRPLYNCFNMCFRFQKIAAINSVENNTHVIKKDENNIDTDTICCNELVSLNFSENH